MSDRKKTSAASKKYVTLAPRELAEMTSGEYLPPTVQRAMDDALRVVEAHTHKIDDLAWQVGWLGSLPEAGRRAPFADPHRFRMHPVQPAGWATRHLGELSDYAQKLTEAANLLTELRAACKAAARAIEKKVDAARHAHGLHAVDVAEIEAD